MRSLLWWGIWLNSCQPTIPPPPISEDTTVRIVREIYGVRAYLLPQALSPSVMESLLSRHTYHLLRKEGIDTARWEATRRYYARYPQRWQALMDKALTVRE